ncbi:glycosyltransferase [Neobacillus cucumis]|uniref:glycosyltransferase n=1 Tax=Neobacillus cucumis TaxID=1740721 RepID=UPI0018DFADA1|nr:glycosyltransferase [Neobacillus cucumis]MBI0577954.1 glycosyltransferase [Neobacillus cucumis]
MKKSLLLMMNSMGIGGVEKALLNFLSVLDQEKFEVTILYIKKGGEYINKIPYWVNVVEVEIPSLERSLLENGSKTMLLSSIKRFKFISSIKILYLIAKQKKRSKWVNIRHGFFDVIGENIPKLNSHFDIALDFHGYTSFTTYYISEKVNANIKATWLHSSNFDNGIKNFLHYYNNYDRVFGVSKNCVEKFIEVFPEFKNKCETFYNIILRDEITSKAERDNGFLDECNGIRILTVGRLSYQKGLDIAIPIASKLKENGFNFKWYVVGDGIERPKLEKLIQVYNVEDNFILLGSMENPYPFIKQCDIYVQPSRSEGYCTTITEACILNKPIITTDVSGAREQIENGKTGIITEIDKDKIYEGIKSLISNIQLRKMFEENLLNEKFDSLKEMKKFYALVGESR